MKVRREQVLYDQNSSFTVEDVIGKVIECVYHVHEEYELTLVESSFGTRFTGTWVDSFAPGSLTLTGPMLPHHYHSNLSDSKSPTWGHARVIKFRHKLCGIDVFSLPEMRPIAKMLEASAFGVDFDAATVKKARPLIEEIFAGKGVHRLSQLFELLDLLAGSDYRRLSHVSQEAMSATPDERLNRVLQLIYDSLDNLQDVPLARAAKRAAMTPESFSRYFKQVTRKNYIEYINEIKLEKACLMLLNTDHTVAQICCDAGFNNLSNFNRQFRKKYDTTPKDFRQTHRK